MKHDGRISAKIIATTTDDKKGMMDGMFVKSFCMPTLHYYLSRYKNGPRPSHNNHHSFVVFDNNLRQGQRQQSFSTTSIRLAFPPYQYATTGSSSNLVFYPTTAAFPRALKGGQTAATLREYHRRHTQQKRRHSTSVEDRHKHSAIASPPQP